MNKTLIAILALLTTVVAPAPAGAEETPPEPDFREAGVILAPSVATGATRLAFINAHAEANGVDGWVIELPGGLEKYRILADAGPVGLCDLDVRFYDAEVRSLGGEATVACEEEGEVRTGAVYAIVEMYLGFDVHFVFEAW